MITNSNSGLWFKILIYKGPSPELLPFNLEKRMLPLTNMPSLISTFSTPLQFLLVWIEVREKLHPNKKKKTYIVNIIKAHSVNVVVYKI
jgi:hypothetical protein